MDGYFVQVPEDEYVQMCQTLDVRKKRIELLEQLCRDMYASIKRWWLWIPDAEFSKHSDLMKEMGLLEGEDE